MYPFISATFLVISLTLVGLGAIAYLFPDNHPQN